MLLLSNGTVCTRSEDGAKNPFFPPDEAVAFGANPAEALLLGWDAHGPVLAAAILPEQAERADAVPLRAAYAQALFASDAMGALAQGAALLAWHNSHGFCARCGQASEMRGGGVRRVCLACAAEHFPRTDPVAIMLAVREERCLMGRGRHFAPGMFSCLAGFIEPGETIENAVRRETFEESGIWLGRVRYHASQPWPFPHSLMIGCLGEALTEEIDPDREELEACRWFGREEVRSMLAGTHPDGLIAPPGGAIASHLIRFWANGGGF